MSWECIRFLDTQDLSPLSHDSHYRRGMARDSLTPFSVSNTAASDLGRPKDCFYQSPEDSRWDRKAGLGGTHCHSAGGNVVPGHQQSLSGAAWCSAASFSQQGGLPSFLLFLLFSDRFLSFFV